RRHAELVERLDDRGDRAEHRAGAGQLAQVVRAEPGLGAVRVSEVEIAGVLELRALRGLQEWEQHRLDVVARQRAVAIGDQLTANAQHRRIARREVEVAAALLEQPIEQRVDGRRAHDGLFSAADSSVLLIATLIAVSSVMRPARTSSASESSNRIIPKARPRCIRFGSWNSLSSRISTASGSTPVTSSIAAATLPSRVGKS